MGAGSGFVKWFRGVGELLQTEPSGRLLAGLWTFGTFGEEFFSWVERKQNRGKTYLFSASGLVWDGFREG